MLIPIIHEDGTENEFEIEVCCRDCSGSRYGWTIAQHDKIAAMKDTIKLPNSVVNEQDFIRYVKSL